MPSEEFGYITSQKSVIEDTCMSEFMGKIIEAGNPDWKISDEDANVLAQKFDLSKGQVGAYRYLAGHRAEDALFDTELDAALFESGEKL